MKKNHTDAILMLFVTLVAMFGAGFCLAKGGGLTTPGIALAICGIAYAAVSTAFFMDATKQVANALARVRTEAWQPLPPFR